jgi:ABC-2 type transport system ATP-binding protein
VSESPAIRIAGLSHRYGERLALQSVSFEVGRGEIFGLLGPNGGGKTTLFKILSTLLLPQEGRAEIFGVNVADRPAEARMRMGVVFQAPALDKKLTVEENLWHQGHLYGLRGDGLTDRIRQKLERVGLWDRRATLVEELSGGLRRRTELAKGFLHQPDLLLLDEPSTGLDPNARREVWNYLSSIRESEATTVVLTTHLMEEAEKCDRIGILDGGRLIAIDRPDRLKAAIGGDVITAVTDRPEELQKQIRERFGVEAALIDDILRIEKQEGHQFIGKLVEAFPGRIQSIRLGKPTLEDVFVHHTGHRFNLSNGAEELKK